MQSSKAVQLPATSGHVVHAIVWKPAMENLKKIIGAFLQGMGRNNCFVSTMCCAPQWQLRTCWELLGLPLSWLQWLRNCAQVLHAWFCVPVSQDKVVTGLVSALWGCEDLDPGCCLTYWNTKGQGVHWIRLFKSSLAVSSLYDKMTFPLIFKLSVSLYLWDRPVQEITSL